MNQTGKPRLVWFDANRVFAAIGVVLIHATTDFGGQPFPDAELGARYVPVFLRSIGEFSGSEMFFLFSLFLMAMRIDKKLPAYSAAIGQQAKRLLVPFAFWTVFYAFFRLIKADTFNYTPFILGQLGEVKSWLGYFVLGSSQYHMHFLPTLFALFLFYPIMRLATRYPIIGLMVVITLGVMNHVQGFLWTLDLDPTLRAYLVRALKVLGYVGYGFAAFAIYGLWKDGIPRGETRLIKRGAFYFAAIASVATLPCYGFAIENGNWGIREGWVFYGHFLMPIFIFFIFVGGQFLEWSPRWSALARYSFGVYLMHPFVIDLYDVGIFISGLSGNMEPWLIVVARIAVVLPLTFFIAIGFSRVKLLAWTIGLGPTPWELKRARSQVSS